MHMFDSFDGRKAFFLLNSFCKASIFLKSWERDTCGKRYWGFIIGDWIIRMELAKWVKLVYFVNRFDMHKNKSIPIMQAT